MEVCSRDVLVEANDEKEAEDIVYNLLCGGGLDIHQDVEYFNTNVIADATERDLNDPQYQKFKYR